MQKNNRLVVGILAHVDAGKTTLAESMLYTSGSIRKLGRVDHKDTFLDTDDIEKERGITIFSKQATLNVGDKEVMLLDTPGHIDFSAEMERTLKVLDYAILVVSGVDKISGHILTLWRLLESYAIPTFLFVNKMDQDGADKEWITNQIKEKFDSNCVDFSEPHDEEWIENIACVDESLLEKYFEEGILENEDIVKQIKERRVFPCFYGSALKIEGIEEFLRALDIYTTCRKYGEEFGARVYKISRDSNGNRLTHLKVTGGKLSVKQVLTYKKLMDMETASDGEVVSKEEEILSEKVNQLCVYSGAKYNTVNEMEAGGVCAVTGLTSTCVGQGLGFEEDDTEAVLEPVLSYKLNIPEGVDVHKTYMDIYQLQEEEPSLRIKWNKKTSSIEAFLMGEVQIEVLQRIIADRFGLNVTFSEGTIVYKETIDTVVEGVGHFEPLKHYAEAHLLIEPDKRGSGISIDVDCGEDDLDKNWQRLIMTHVLEKQHIGTLIGAELTDVKITLVAGKAHLKHTEGGDFRQATYRAIRQGLMQAREQGKVVLLEPVYEYRLEVPSEMVGRAISDIGMMNGSFDGPEIDGETAVITGIAPVARMQGYGREVIAYTSGVGSIYYEFKGYDVCHNMDEVVESVGYDPEADVDNPTGSVFCSHGAGYNVPWNEVYENMHLESVLAKRQARASEVEEIEAAEAMVANGHKRGDIYNQHQKESMQLDEIFYRTYGEIKRYKNSSERIDYSRKTSEKPYKYKPQNRKKEYILVDGYNIIYAWKELKELAEDNMEAARNKLMDILCNYQGYMKNTIILVFDAYKVEGGVGSIYDYHNIHVVYTKESETADMYIEKVTKDIATKHNVKVATSDVLEQVIIMSQGAYKMSADEFRKDIERTDINIRENHLNRGTGDKNYLFDHLPEEAIKHMEDVRLGKDEF